MAGDNTPLMQQFYEFKSQHPDAILFLRCGDFYEMFHEDAKIVARELQLVLTSRNKNSDNPIPMAGVPYHAYEDYAAKLIDKGYKIAICEQVEDPKEAKGIVKREVVQVITPGTVTLSGVLKPGKNNFLAAIHLEKKQIFLAYLDVSTGQAFTTGFPHNKSGLSQLREEIYRIHPSELLIHKKLLEDGEFNHRVAENFQQKNLRFQTWDKRIPQNTPYFLDWIEPAVMNSSGINQNYGGRFCFEILFQYMESCSIQTQISHVSQYCTEEKLIIDSGSVRNLELVSTIHEGGGKSLLETIDHTVTAAGARLLKQFLLSPLVDPDQIKTRLDTVELLVSRPAELHRLRELMRDTYDLYRLVNRLLNQQASGKDLVAICQSLSIIPELNSVLADCSLQSLTSELEHPNELVSTIENAIVDEPPARLTDGKLFKPGYHKELDHLSSLLRDADSILREIEEKEKAQQDIKSLKIKSNKVFGYYIEIPKAYSDKVPAHYVRKQTLSNAERYITDELKKLESEIFSAEHKIAQLEYSLFQELRKSVLEQVGVIHAWAQLFAWLDVMVSFAKTAGEQRYCRPVFCKESKMVVAEGRHPVVEASTDHFVPNDHYLDQDTNRVQIITGPNMGGKSTYLRQTAIIAIMAQMGSFVPATSCETRLFDRIFTRIGASDDLGGGRSTFMVEMSETAYLLKNATENSLILLDEIGRGTATFDGLSIAWSVIEYIASEIGCMCLFATHYHEITQITELDPCIKNYSVSVLEENREILFQHRITRGSANKSYGIHVAKLAGIPRAVLKQASSILKELEETKTTVIGLDTKSKKLCVKGQQRSLFGNAAPETKEESPLQKKLKSVHPDSMSPMEALQVLYDLKDLASKE